MGGRSLVREERGAWVPLAAIILVSIFIISTLIYYRRTVPRLEHERERTHAKLVEEDFLDFQARLARLSEGESLTITVPGVRGVPGTLTRPFFELGAQAGAGPMLSVITFTTRRDLEEGMHRSENGLHENIWIEDNGEIHLDNDWWGNPFFTHTHRTRAGEITAYDFHVAFRFEADRSENIDNAWVYAYLYAEEFPSLRIRFSDNSVLYLYATEDSYVYSKYPNSNYDYGREDHIRAYNYYDSYNNVDRPYRSYLKFDLSRLPEGKSIDNAQLALACGYLKEGPVTVEVYSFVNDAWDEDTVTWNTTGDNTLLSSVSVDDKYETYFWDVTTYVQGEFGGDNVASFLIKLPNEAPGYTTGAYFRSREYLAAHVYIAPDLGGIPDIDTFLGNQVLVRFMDTEIWHSWIDWGWIQAEGLSANVQAGQTYYVVVTPKAEYKYPNVYNYYSIAHSAPRNPRWVRGQVEEENRGVLWYARETPEVNKRWIELGHNWPFEDVEPVYVVQYESGAWEGNPYHPGFKFYSEKYYYWDIQTHGDDELYLSFLYSDDEYSAGIVNSRGLEDPDFVWGENFRISNSVTVAAVEIPVRKRGNPDDDLEVVLENSTWQQVLTLEAEEVGGDPKPTWYRLELPEPVVLSPGYYSLYLRVRDYTRYDYYVIPLDNADGPFPFNASWENDNSYAFTARIAHGAENLVGASVALFYQVDMPFRLLGEGYKLKGVYTSPLLYPGERVRWLSLNWNQSVPAGADLRVEVRVGDMIKPYDPNVEDYSAYSWSEWKRVEPGQDLREVFGVDYYQENAEEREANVIAEALQFRVLMERDSVNETPRIWNLILKYYRGVGVYRPPLPRHWIHATTLDFASGENENLDIRGGSVSLRAIGAEGEGWDDSPDDSPSPGYYGEAVVGTGTYVYLITRNPATGDIDLYEFDPNASPGSQWTTEFTEVEGPAVWAKNGTAMVYGFDDYLYVFFGGAYDDTGSFARHYFYKYGPLSGVASWTSLADTSTVNSGGQGAGNAAVFVDGDAIGNPGDDFIFAFIGSKPANHGYGFGRYSINNNNWTQLSTPPFWDGTDDGCSLAWGGENYIYAFRGEYYETGVNVDFARYNISTGGWEELPDLPFSEVGGVCDGGSMIWLGYWDVLPDYFFAVSGGYSSPETPSRDFWQYDLSAGEWTRLEDVALAEGFTEYNGCRLAYADGNIWAWQGREETAAGGGDDFSEYPIAQYYENRGELLSLAFDAGENAEWFELHYEYSEPEQTTLEVYLQFSDDGSNWTETGPYESGATIGQQSRYVRYRLVLETDDNKRTPRLKEIKITYLPVALITAENIWRQTDWGGGEGQLAWSDATRYYQGDNVSGTVSVGDLVVVSGPENEIMGNKFRVDQVLGGENLETVAERLSLRFRARRSGDVYGVRVRVEGWSYADLAAEIRQDNSANPGTPGNSITVENTVEVGAGWNYIGFDPPATLTAGEVYHIVLRVVPWTETRDWWVQTDWSGGPQSPLQVGEWTSVYDNFYENENVNWTLVSGKIRAENVPSVSGFGPGDNMVITEAIGNPANEDTDEFVELYNRSDHTIDINGWKIDDGDATPIDVIEAFDEGTLGDITDPDVITGTTSIPRGAYVVILDQNYAGGTQPYDFPPNTYVVTVDDADIGNGIAQGDMPYLQLLNASDEVISRWSNCTDTSQSEPNSVEMENYAAGDVSNNWDEASGSTPGAQNSNYLDGELSETIEYENGWFTSSVFDTGDEDARWNYIDWVENEPAGTDLVVYARFENTDPSGWSDGEKPADGSGTPAWEQMTNPQEFSTYARYAQYAVEFTATDNTYTAELENIRLRYGLSLGVSGTWSQTTWVGGGGQTDWSLDNRFDNSENVDWENLAGSLQLRVNRVIPTGDYGNLFRVDSVSTIGTLDGDDNLAVIRFEAEADKEITGVRFYAVGVSGSPTLRVRLMGDNGAGMPDFSNVLAENDEVEVSGDGWVLAEFPEVSLTAGELYHIVISREPTTATTENDYVGAEPVTLPDSTPRVGVILDGSYSYTQTQDGVYENIAENSLGTTTIDDYVDDYDNVKGPVLNFSNMQQEDGTYAILREDNDPTWTQTSWDGTETGAPAQVNQWDSAYDNYYDADNVNTADGENIKLSSGVLESPVKTSIESGAGVNAARMVRAGDIDGDGDVDIAITAYTADDVIVYWNNGAGSFTKLIVDSSFDGARGLDLADIDSDGDIDLVATAYSADDVVWYRNNGDQTFTRQDIDVSTDSVAGCHAIDFDSDGDTDVLVAAAGTIDGIRLFTNGGTGTSWTESTVGSEVGMIMCHGADFDGDGDVDVAGLTYADDLLWYQNGGGGSFTETLIASPNTYYFGGLYGADVDGDGDNDIIVGAEPGDLLAWYQNDGSGNFTEQIIASGTEVDGASLVYATDIEGDGDVDVLVGAKVADDVLLYLSDGGATPSFTKNTIDSNLDGAHGVWAGDFDGDGSLDVAATAYDGDEVAWYKVLGYLSDAYLESSVYDSGDVNTIWNNLSWTATTPTDTSLEVWVRFDNTLDANNLPDTAWENCTSNPYSLGSRLARYVQYRIVENTENAEKTPVFQEIQINYSPPAVGYSENINFNILGTPSNASEREVQIRYQLDNTNDDFRLQVYDWVNDTYENRLTLSSESWDVLTYTLTPSENADNGDVRVRIIDLNPDATSATDLRVDYLRVRSTVPRTDNYRLNWGHEITNVGTGYDNYEIRVYGYVERPIFGMHQNDGEVTTTSTIFESFPTPATVTLDFPQPSDVYMFFSHDAWVSNDSDDPGTDDGVWIALRMDGTEYAWAEYKRPGVGWSYQTQARAHMFFNVPAGSHTFDVLWKVDDENDGTDPTGGSRNRRLLVMAFPAGQAWGFHENNDDTTTTSSTFTDFEDPASVTLTLSQTSDVHMFFAHDVRISDDGDPDVDDRVWITLRMDGTGYAEAEYRRPGTGGASQTQAKGHMFSNVPAGSHTFDVLWRTEDMGATPGTTTATSKNRRLVVMAFPAGQEWGLHENDDEITTTSTSFVDFEDPVTVTLNLTQTSDVYMFFSHEVQENDDEDQGIDDRTWIALRMDGTEYAWSEHRRPNAGWAHQTQTKQHLFLNVPAGSHTFDVRWKVDDIDTGDTNEPTAYSKNRRLVVMAFPKENVGVYIWDNLNSEWDFIDNLPTSPGWVENLILGTNISDYIREGSLHLRYFENSADAIQTTIHLDYVVCEEEAAAPVAGQAAIRSTIPLNPVLPPPDIDGVRDNVWENATRAISPENRQGGNLCENLYLMNDDEFLYIGWVMNGDPWDDDNSAHYLWALETKHDVAGTENDSWAPSGACEVDWAFKPDYWIQAEIDWGNDTFNMIELHESDGAGGFTGYVTLTPGENWRASVSGGWGEMKIALSALGISVEQPIDILHLVRPDNNKPGFNDSTPFDTNTSDWGDGSGLKLYARQTYWIEPIQKPYVPPPVDGPRDAVWDNYQRAQSEEEKAAEDLCENFHLANDDEFLYIGWSMHGDPADDGFSAHYVWALETNGDEAGTANDNWAPLNSCYVGWKNRPDYWIQASINWNQDNFFQVELHESDGNGGFTGYVTLTPGENWFGSVSGIWGEMKIALSAIGVSPGQSIDIVHFARPAEDNTGFSDSTPFDSNCTYYGTGQNLPIYARHTYLIKRHPRTNVLWTPDNEEWVVKNEQPVYVLENSASPEGNSFASSSDYPIYLQYYAGENFTVSGGDRQIVRVGALVMAPSGTPGDHLRFAIRDSNNDNLIVGVLVENTAAPSSYTWRYVDIFPTTLTDGSSYRFILYSPGSDATAYWEVSAPYTDASGAIYAAVTYEGTDSVATRSTNSGSSWTDNDQRDILYNLRPGTPTYETSGYLQSSWYDSGDPSTNWGTITFSGNWPAGTDNDVYVQVSDSNTGGWEASGGPYNSGDTIGLTGQYIRYRVYLSTTDDTVTPRLDDISIDYSTPTAAGWVQLSVSAPLNENLPYDSRTPGDFRILRASGGSWVQLENQPILVLHTDLNMDGILDAYEGNAYDENAEYRIYGSYRAGIVFELDGEVMDNTKLLRGFDVYVKRAGAPPALEYTLEDLTAGLILSSGVVSGVGNNWDWTNVSLENLLLNGHEFRLSFWTTGGGPADYYSIAASATSLNLGSMDRATFDGINTYAVFDDGSGWTENLKRDLLLNFTFADDHLPSGVLESSIFDAGEALAWRNIEVNVTLSGGSVQVLVRTGEDADPYDEPTPPENWTEWVVTTGAIDATARYAQYKLILQSPDPGTTPAIHEVELLYTEQAIPPKPHPLLRTWIQTTVDDFFNERNQNENIQITAPGDITLRATEYWGNRFEGKSGFTPRAKIDSRTKLFSYRFQPKQQENLVRVRLLVQIVQEGKVIAPGDSPGNWDEDNWIRVRLYPDNSGRPDMSGAPLATAVGYPDKQWPGEWYLPYPRAGQYKGNVVSEPKEETHIGMEFNTVVTLYPDNTYHLVIDANPATTGFISADNYFTLLALKPKHERWINYQIINENRGVLFSPDNGTTWWTSEDKTSPLYNREPVYVLDVSLDDNDLDLEDYDGNPYYKSADEIFQHNYVGQKFPVKKDFDNSYAENGFVTGALEFFMQRAGDPRELVVGISVRESKLAEFVVPTPIDVQEEDWSWARFTFPYPLTLWENEEYIVYIKSPASDLRNYPVVNTMKTPWEDVTGWVGTGFGDEDAHYVWYSKDVEAWLRKNHRDVPFRFIIQYTGPGTYISKVYDAGQVADWRFLEWDETTPAGTRVRFYVRVGGSPNWLGSWQGPYVGGRADLDNLPSARYLQYRVELSPNASRTLAPAVHEVRIGYRGGFGVLALNCEYTQYPSQTWVYEGGAVILVQDDTSIMYSEPELVKVSADGNNLEVTVDYIFIKLEGTHGGSAPTAKSLTVHMPNSPLYTVKPADGVPNRGEVEVTVVSDYAEAWEEYFELLSRKINREGANSSVDSTGVDEGVVRLIIKGNGTGEDIIYYERVREFVVRAAG